MAEIAELRERMQQALHQVLEEAERVRAALAALDGSAPSRPARRANRFVWREGDFTLTPPPGKPPLSPSPAASIVAGRLKRASRTVSRKGRAPRGSVRQAILDGLAGGEALTSGQLAAAASLKPTTVATALPRLVKDGVVVKADRGYQLAARPDAHPDS